MDDLVGMIADSLGLDELLAHVRHSPYSIPAQKAPGDVAADQPRGGAQRGRGMGPAPRTSPQWTIQYVTVTEGPVSPRHQNGARWLGLLGRGEDVAAVRSRVGRLGVHSVLSLRCCCDQVVARSTCTRTTGVFDEHPPLGELFAKPRGGRHNAQVSLRRRLFPPVATADNTGGIDQAIGVIRAAQDALANYGRSARQHRKLADVAQHVGRRSGTPRPCRHQPPGPSMFVTNGWRDRSPSS